MQLKTILNWAQKSKLIVYRKVCWTGNAEAPALEIEVIKLDIVGAESLGVRSLCCAINAQEHWILGLPE